MLGKLCSIKSVIQFNMTILYLIDNFTLVYACSNCSNVSKNLKLVKIPV